MTQRPVRGLLQATLVFTAVMTGAPAVAALLADSDTFYQTGPYRYLKFAPQDSSETGLNDHPVEIDGDLLARVLRKVVVPKSGGFFGDETDYTQFFADSQARQLGTQLAAGLRQARPDQDILFALEAKRNKAFVFEERSVMAGRAFYRNGQLNLIIGEPSRYINKEFQRVYDASESTSLLRFNHGSRRRSSGKVKQVMAEMVGVSYKNIGGRVRNDWFVIEPEIAIAAMLREEQLRNQQVAVPAGVGGPGGVSPVAPAAAAPEDPASRQARLEAARMKRDQRELKVEMARMRKQMQEIGQDESPVPAPTAAGSTSLVQGVEQRLTTLQSLREKGLITDEEFEAKRQAIIEDL